MVKVGFIGTGLMGRPMAQQWLGFADADYSALFAAIYPQHP